MDKIIEEIKQICPHDFYEIGHASLSGLLNNKYTKYNYGLSLARKLDDYIIDNISNGPTNLYYDLYHQINNELNTKTKEICNLLKVFNIEACPIKATVKDSELDDNYRKTLRYSFSHKMAATRSGIGWIGKTDLLITSRFGPRVRLASILMTSSISDAGNPINVSQCGDCNTCVKNCPAQAATGQLWTIKIDRNEFYNPFKCREFCKQISAERIKKDISLCGICMSVCPKGKKEIRK
jgi:epoxyqueuosine reductase QueG